MGITLSAEYYSEEMARQSFFSPWPIGDLVSQYKVSYRNRIPLAEMMSPQETIGTKSPPLK